MLVRPQPGGGWLSLPGQEEGVPLPLLLASYLGLVWLLPMCSYVVGVGKVSRSRSRSRSRKGEKTGRIETVEFKEAKVEEWPG